MKQQGNSSQNFSTRSAQGAFCFLLFSASVWQGRYAICFQYLFYLGRSIPMSHLRDPRLPHWAHGLLGKHLHASPGACDPRAHICLYNTKQICLVAVTLPWRKYVFCLCFFFKAGLLRKQGWNYSACLPLFQKSVWTTWLFSNKCESKGRMLMILNDDMFCEYTKPNIGGRDSLWKSYWYRKLYHEA